MSNNSLFIALLMGVASLGLNAQERSKFYFAQITDTHLSTHTGIKTEDLLRSVAQINATDSIDFVLVTGDETDEGDKASLKLVKPCLDLLKVPYYVIPGNHETKWSASGGTAFGEVFGKDRFCFEHKGVVFIGFNSGFLERMADGHVAQADIRWISNQLKNVGKEKPVILVTHYPVRQNDVDNWYQVINAVRGYNVRLFIGGHYHRNLVLDYDGIPGVLIRSNQQNKDKKQGYGIYCVDRDSITAYVQQVGEEKTKLASFPMQQANRMALPLIQPHTNDSINQCYPQVSSLWKVQTGYEIYASPVADDRNVYVGDESGQMAAYSLKNGKRQWSFAAKGRIIGTAAVDSGILVFTSVDGNIYALHAKDGTLLWTVKTEAPLVSAVTISNGVAYVGGGDHCFRAIDLVSGKTVWSYEPVDGHVETKPLVVNDKVIFGAWDKTLYALDTATGKLDWTWKVNKNSMFYSPAAVWPVEVDGKVFVVDPRRVFTALDLKDGKMIWQTAQSKVRESLGRSLDGNRLYVKTMNDSVACYDAHSSYPQQIWETNVGFGYEFAPSMLLEKDGVVYGTTKRGLVFALDALTGKLLWKQGVSSGVVNTVYPLGGGRLIYTAAGGEIGILKAKKKMK